MTGWSPDHCGEARDLGCKAEVAARAPWGWFGSCSSILNGRNRSDPPRANVYSKEILFKLTHYHNAGKGTYYEILIELKD